MSLADQRKLGLQQIRQAFQRREGDCGSSEVQGKLLCTVDLQAEARNVSLSLLISYVVMQWLP